MDLLERNRALEVENDLLRNRVAELEAILGVGPRSPRPILLGLSPLENKLLAVLRRRGEARRDHLMAVIYAEKALDMPDDKIIAVLVSKINRKLRPWGIAIENIWGHGYKLSAEAKAKIDGMLHQ